MYLTAKAIHLEVFLDLSKHLLLVASILC